MINCYQQHEVVFILKKRGVSMKKKEEIDLTENVESKKKKNNKEKKKKDNLLKGIKSEMKKVTWPTRKEVFKYTIATLIFCAIIMVFFQLLELGLSVVKGVFN
jgi:preprotein translocase subunit SecE